MVLSRRRRSSVFDFKSSAVSRESFFPLLVHGGVSFGFLDYRFSKPFRFRIFNFQSLDLTDHCLASESNAVEFLERFL